MNSLLRRGGGVWIGWPGESARIGDPKRQEIIDKWKAQDGLISG